MMRRCHGLVRTGATTLAAAVALSLLIPTGTAHPLPRGKVFQVAALHVGDHIPPGLETLQAGLTATGWEEGRNIHLRFRNLADEASAGRTAREFVEAGVDLIVAFGNPAVRAARAATSESPIVMVHVTDPVAHGFVKTLARPGGNLTGFVFFAVSPGKDVELFKEMVPGLQRLLVLLDPEDPMTASQLAEIRKAADILKVRVTERRATHRGDLERIFGSIRRDDIDGVVSASNTLQVKHSAALIRLALVKRVPVAGYRRDAAAQGALFSYAPDDAAVGRAAATVVDRILRGAKPADLPVEQPRKFELVINLRTAKALGLTIPPSLLQRADQVIE